MRKLIFLLLLIVLLSNNVNAQTGNVNSLDGVGFVYNKEKIFGLRVHTNVGIVPEYTIGKLRSYHKTTFYTFNLGELRHPKEYRQSADPTLSRSLRPFVYGKINNFFALRGSYGVKKYFSEKAKRKGVSVGMSWSVGGTLGILKPYYLAISRPLPDQPGAYSLSAERYTAENAAYFLDNTKIKGAASFFKGITELGFRPGANASISLHLDWGAFDELVKAFELGAMIDVFPGNIPIFAGDKNVPYFFNFFIAAQLGKRE